MSVPKPVEDLVHVQPLPDDSRPAIGPTMLPRPLTPFVGRERPLTDVVALLQDSGVRLLTLTGPGGVGKTRLALAAAEALAASFRDGVVFVPLATVVDPAMVIPAIAAALEINDSGDRPLLNRLARELSDRRMLLVLDNLEQALPAGPAIADLLQAARGVAALVTSRSPLRVTGEREYAVAPLDVLATIRNLTPEDLAGSEAGALFVQRAQNVRPGFELTDGNVAAVAEICRRLDGLPLALELAAARTKVLNPADLLARLERKLYVLTGGRSDSPARQRTMRDAIAWSYDLLDAAHQALFRRLAVFRGGCTIGMIEHLFGDPSSPAAIRRPGTPDDSPSVSTLDILDGLEQLVDQSLLVRDEQMTGESRLRMLETIREYGLEQLILHGEEATVFGVLAGYWRAEAEASWDAARSLETLDRALHLLEADHDNIRAALDWLEAEDPAGAIDLAGALFWLWFVHGHHTEALHRLGRLLAAPPEGTPARALARALLAAGAFAHFRSQPDQAKRYIDDAIALWRDVQDPWGLGFGYFILGVTAEDAGDYRRARTLLHDAIANLEAANDSAMIGSARFHLANVAFGLGELDEAEGILKPILEGDGAPAHRVLGWATHLRGLVAQASGDLPRAAGYFQDSLRRFWETKAPAGYGESLAGIAVVLASIGDATAARFWGAAERLNDDRGEKFHQPELGVYEAAMQRLEATAGGDVFATERAIGHGWTTEEAIQAALALQPAFPTQNRPLARTASPAGLSTREVEVLRLVTDGWTNDRIADSLFLSPRTVHAHLTSVYRKLGVSNRAEAVRIAIERGLV